MKVKIFSDGGSRNNPGHAAAAAICFDHENNLIDFETSSYNLLTNNQAEYEGLLLGINLAIKNGIKEVEFFLDSELIVKQLNGIYKIKDEKIKKIYPLIESKLLSLTHYTFNHILRDKNKYADKLVNITLDAFENGKES